MMAINAKAPFFLYREALPLLKKSDNPIIINISSVVGRKGYANQAVYSASKHALMGFTKSMAKELKDAGIRVAALFLISYTGNSAIDEINIRRASGTPRD